MNKIAELALRVIAMWLGFAVILTVLSLIGNSIPFALWLLGLVVSTGLWAKVCFMNKPG